MKFEILKPENRGFANPIIWNFKDLKDKITKSLQKYKNLIFTDDQISLAKIERANLNRFKTEIEKNRIDIKKECLQYYNGVEKEVKELTILIDPVVQEIDVQIKKFEHEKKMEKRVKLFKYYEGKAGNLLKIVPFTTIFKEEWLNASFSLRKAETAINYIFDGISKDLKIVSNINSKFQQQIKVLYLKTLDLSGALQENTRLELEMKKLEEYEENQRLEKEKIAEKLAEKQKEIERPAVTKVFQGLNRETVREKTFTPVPLPRQEKKPEPEKSLIKLGFHVWATSEQLNKLRIFLNTNGIPFKPISK